MKSKQEVAEGNHNSKSKWARSHCRAPEELEIIASLQSKQGPPDLIRSLATVLLRCSLNREEYASCRLLTRKPFDEGDDRQKSSVESRLRKALNVIHFSTGEVQRFASIISGLTYKQTKLLSSWAECGFKVTHAAQLMGIKSAAASRLLRRAIARFLRVVNTPS